MADIFGVASGGPLKADLKRALDRQNYYVFWYYVKKNSAGGQAFYLPNTHPWLHGHDLEAGASPARCRVFRPPWASCAPGRSMKAL